MAVNNTNGKGSKRRPTNEQVYRDNWDEIFRKNPECPRCGRSWEENEDSECCDEQKLDNPQDT